MNNPFCDRSENVHSHRILQEERKDMFYLTMHSTHFIYGYMASDIVKNHSDSERGNPLLPHGLLFPISSKGSFICITPQPLLHQLEHWLEWEIAQWVHHEGSIQRPIAPWANALTTELHLAPWIHLIKQTIPNLKKIYSKSGVKTQL